MKIDDKILKKGLTEALEKAEYKMEGKKPKKRKFDETIDIVINLRDLNLNDPKSRIDQEYMLPNNIISTKLPSVCIIAKDEIIVAGKKIGLTTIDVDGLNKLNNEEKKNKKKFVKRYEYFVVENSVMKDVARVLARFLGPLGKMPKPFPSGFGIISSVDDLNNAVDRYKKIIRIQVKKTPLIQTKVGKKSMDKDKLFENLKAVVEHIASLLPHKMNNFRSIYLKTTMGPAVKVA